MGSRLVSYSTRGSSHMKEFFSEKLCRPLQQLKCGEIFRQILLFFYAACGTNWSIELDMIMYIQKCNIKFAYQHWPALDERYRGKQTASCFCKDEEKIINAHSSDRRACVYGIMQIAVLRTAMRKRCYQLITSNLFMRNYFRIIWNHC